MSTFIAVTFSEPELLFIQTAIENVHKPVIVPIENYQLHVNLVNKVRGVLKGLAEDADARHRAATQPAGEANPKDEGTAAEGSPSAPEGSEQPASGTHVPVGALPEA